MSRKVLSVIDTAYRACQEEQDDAGLWFTAAVARAGLDVTVLLTGNAVSYAVPGHRSKSLAVGGGEVAHPFDPRRDIERLADEGVSFFLVREDAEDRGLAREELLETVEVVSRERVAALYEAHDSIWNW